MSPIPDEILEMRRQRLEAKRPLIDRYQAHIRHTEFFDLPYRLFVPESTGEKLPLVLFLHGLGEVGMDNVSQLAAYHGGTVWVEEQLAGRQEACFVLAPQCPRADDLRWSTEQLMCIGHLIRELMEIHPIDPKRIYVTGLSLGGFGTCSINRIFPGMFAALVPCCSAFLAGMPGNNVIRDFDIGPCAEAMLKKPVWFFHAEDDEAVPVSISRMLYDNLYDLGRRPGEDFRYTEYPADLGYNHACWEPAYANAEMRAWLFRQKLD